MKKYFDTVANANGSPVSGALVTVLNFGTATPSTIFSDAAGTVSLANPITTNSRGFFEFYAADGRYSLSITGAGFSAVSVTDILLDDPADANTVVINGGSVNGTPIGGTTPSTGAFTTLSATGNVTLGNATTDTLNVGNGGLIKDAAGNVGIGVTPSAWGGYGAPVLELPASGAIVAAGGAVTYGANFYYSAGDFRYKLSGVPASYFAQQNSNHRWFTSPPGTAGAPISFTQAMELDASGTLALHAKYGLTNGFDFIQDNASSGAATQYTNHPSGTASGAFYQSFTYNGISIATITQSGTTAVAYNTTSDHRLKENVRDADASRFMDIKFRDFEWVDGRHDCGVIAHELQQVYPDLVLGEKDATEVRTVEITPAVPAVTEQVLVTPEVPTAYDGDQIVTPGVAAVYETVEVTPAVPVVTEEQTFPVYQQVNYTGLIGRMGTRVQALQRTVDAQAALIEAMEARLSALEAA